MKIITTVSILLALLAITPLHAAKGGRSSSTLIADFVAHSEAFVPMGPTLLSRCSGPSTSKFYVEWPRHDLCVFTGTFDVMGNLIGSDAGVKPAGMEADPTRAKELCNPDELCDDPILSAPSKRGTINSIQLFIQDDIGTEGIMHESEVVSVPGTATNPCGFRVHVHRDGVPIWRLSGHLGGPRVEMVGTVSIADVWYRPATPCK